MAKNKHYGSGLLFFVIAVLVALRILLFFYHFDYPVIDQSAYRQAHNMMIIRQYIREGTNLLLPKLDYIETGGYVHGGLGYAMLEFPLYQGIVAFLCRPFNDYPDIFARLVSILSTIVSGLFLFLISRKFFSDRISMLASSIFMFTPLVIFYSRAIMMEPLIMMFNLVALYLYIRWIDKGGLLLWSLAVIFGCLAFLHKPVYALVIFITILFYQHQKKGIKGLFDLDFILAMSTTAIITCMWFAHGSVINSLFPSHFMITFKSLRTWYFGSVSQRLSILYYLRIVARSAIFIFGIFGIILFIVSFRKWTATPRIFRIWLLSSIAYIFAFITLNAEHDYYQYPLIPIASIFQAIGIEEIIEHVKERKNRRNLLLAGIVLFLFSVNIMLSMDRFKPKEYSFYDVSKISSQFIPKRSMVLFIADIMHPDYFYISDTKGYFMNLPDVDISGLKTLIYSREIQYLVVAGKTADQLKNNLKEFKLLYDQPITRKFRVGRVWLDGTLLIYKIKN